MTQANQQQPSEQDQKVRGEQPEATMAPAWYSVDVKPERAGWYNVWREMDGHRSVRCWDDSAEAWFYVGDRHKVFVPNNSFTHWSELPRPHLSRLSSEAIESASKEAVKKIVKHSANAIIYRREDVEEDFELIIREVFSAAIEKARSK